MQLIFWQRKKNQKGFSYFFNSGECYTVQKQANAVLSSLKKYNTFMSSFTLSFQSLRRVLITQLKVTYKNHLKTACSKHLSLFITSSITSPSLHTSLSQFQNELGVFWGGFRLYRFFKLTTSVCFKCTKSSRFQLIDMA